MKKLDSSRIFTRCIRQAWRLTLHTSYQPLTFYADCFLTGVLSEALRTFPSQRFGLVYSIWDNDIPASSTLLLMSKKQGTGGFPKENVCEFFVSYQIYFSLQNII